MEIAAMTVAERLRGALLSGPELPGDCRCKKPRRTLITDEPWDCYRLESLLVIRREGRYTMWLPEESAISEGETKTIPVVMHRQGVTLFAWNRGAVLEDRAIDHVAAAGGGLAWRIGTTNQMITRLIRSGPESLARSVPSPAERSLA
jgi:hypothetical protein